MVRFYIILILRTHHIANIQSLLFTVGIPSWAVYTARDHDDTTISIRGPEGV